MTGLHLAPRLGNVSLSITLLSLNPLQHERILVCPGLGYPFVAVASKANT